MSDRQSENEGRKKGLSNGAVVMACMLFVVTMGGMAYAAVPLYQLFCQVTGYGGTTQRAEQQYSDTILDRTIKVRFDANVNGLPWDFQPKQREVELKIGETIQIAYEAVNKSSRPRAGQATFNVTPQAAGGYFNKVECFCFTEVELQPGETLDMPVVFFIDPAIVEQVETKNIETITLSYTFFPHEQDAPVAAAPSDGEGETDRL
ncbi:cytochrome c oxidase assembly protein [Pararhizobium haloflavum]|uniref:cytochrome c oxidase assembly protein n=1 Tax=Pararhizobium haloflavum TaxID=2037914 RepID=UPI000C178040|nr:cytochrome c oxidase assembly protein [Pararhizobium haloflavum]